MNTEIVPFVFDGHELGHIMLEGIPWFVASDIAGILGLTNPRKAVADHVDREDRDGVTIRDAIGRNQRQTVVNESGLYALIFGSRLPTAKRFKRWVTNEVLPEIRRTGRFAPGAQPAMGMPFLLPGPKPARKIFPDEFFKELFRLKNKSVVSLQKAPWIAQVVVNLIYQRIEECVFDTLNLLNPTVQAKSSGKRWRRFKLHQFVADGAPMEKLIVFVNRCCEAMSNYSRWSSFYAAWDQKYPIRRDLPHELRVTFADDSELLFTFMYELEASK
jgi:prophage antirepressor-like protein